MEENKPKQQKDSKRMTWLQKLYYPFGAVLLLIFSTHLNFIIDYCITQPDMKFLTFIRDYHWEDVNRIGFSVIFFGLLFVILYCLVNRYDVTVAIIGALCFLLAYADRYMYINRNELFNYSDCKLTEAANTAANTVEIDWSDYYYTLVLFVGALFLLSVLVEIFCRKGKYHFNSHYLVRGGIFAGALLALVIFVPGFNSVENVRKFEQTEIADVNGNFKHALFQFFENKSVGYDTEGTDESYRFLKEKAEEEAESEELEEAQMKYRQDREVSSGEMSEQYCTPNVIAILSESWWDYDNCDFSNVSLSGDPMATYKELKKECLTGHISVNVFGGGTVSSEYEFLTGSNTKYLLGANDAYTQIVDRESIPTIVDYFNSLSYQTIAVHPYYGEFYKRDQIYRTYGFDKMIFQPDMLFRDEYDKFISDDSLADQIIYEYEHKENGSDMFLWAVSVGNHCNTLSYDHEADENYPYAIQVQDPQGLLEEDEKKNVTSFVNGNELASQAYKKLVDYFSRQEEPTVILMFGDHIPALDTAADEFGLDQTDLSIESLSKMYQTPMVLWKNYEGGEEIDAPDGEFIGYLSSKLIDYAGLPDCEMQQISHYENEVFKADTVWFVLDGEGNEVTQLNEEQLELIANLKMLQYDQIYGEGEMNNLWTPILDGTGADIGSTWMK